METLQVVAMSIPRQPQVFRRGNLQLGRDSSNISGAPLGKQNQIEYLACGKKRSELHPHCSMVANMKFEKVPQQAVQTQHFRTTGLHLVRFLVGLPVGIKNPVKLLGLLPGAGGKHPPLISEEGLDASSGNPKGLTSLQKSHALGIEHTILQAVVDPIVGHHTNEVDMAPKTGVRSQAQRAMVNADHLLQLQKLPVRQRPSSHPASGILERIDHLGQLACTPRLETGGISACDLHIPCSTSGQV
jgi:hypothetical protein